VKLASSVVSTKSSFRLSSPNRSRKKYRLSSAYPNDTGTA